MFSKLKKLVGKTEEDHGDGFNGGMVSSMEPHLQRKFARGIHYNMKIVIRGDKNVGKTSLLQRLQGFNFKDEYVPSEEIQVANIQWNFKTSDEVVKVEIWDVVDKSSKKKTISSLKVSNSAASDSSGVGETEQFGLDAETLDVYKGAHGVIMMMDLTKVWTFEYVKREMERIVAHLPVLILVNHRDMGHHQGGSSVTVEQVKGFVTHLDRPHNAAAVLVAESSMRNGFGLKYIHKFFNLPFLQLQREAVEMQLQQNKTDMDTTLDELEVLLESPEQNYEAFIELLGDIRRREADKLTPPKNVHGIPHVKKSATNSSPAVSASSSGVMAPPAHPHPVPNPLFNKPINTNTHSENNNNATPPPKTPEKTPEKKKTGFFSFTAKNTVTDNIPPMKSSSGSNNAARAEKSSVKDINDFVPDDDVSGDFLADAEHGGSAQGNDGGKSRATLVSDDEEEDDGNPMVAGFDDEVEIDHFEPVHMEFRARSTLATPTMAISSLSSPKIEVSKVADFEEEPVIEHFKQPEVEHPLPTDGYSDEEGELFHEKEPFPVNQARESSQQQSVNVDEYPSKPTSSGDNPTENLSADEEDSVQAEEAPTLSIINPDEFSSWLKTVEKRETNHPVGEKTEKTFRKHSAGLITATSLDDSRIDNTSLHSPENSTTKEVKEKSKASKSDKTKKKSSSKKEGDNGEKKSKKKRKDKEMGEVEKEEVKEPAVVSRKPAQYSVTKRLSDADVHEVLERELEDFLASEDE